MTSIDLEVVHFHGGSVVAGRDTRNLYDYHRDSILYGMLYQVCPTSMVVTVQNEKNIPGIALELEPYTKTTLQHITSMPTYRHTAYIYRC